MTKIVSRKLPNAISNADIGDPTVRNKVMLLQENIQSLSSQLAEAQKALVELQGGSGRANVDVSGLAVQVAPLVADVVYEKTEEASGYAASASTSATNAATSASTAEQRVAQALNGSIYVGHVAFGRFTLDNYEVISKDITKSGFVPVSVAGFRSSTIYAHASRWYIEKGDGAYSLIFRLSNMRNSSISVDIEAYVLYVRQSMVE